MAEVAAVARARPRRDRAALARQIKEAARLLEAVLPELDASQYSCTACGLTVRTNYNEAQVHERIGVMAPKLRYLARLLLQPNKEAQHGVTMRGV